MKKHTEMLATCLLLIKTLSFMVMVISARGDQGEPTTVKLNGIVTNCDLSTLNNRNKICTGLTADHFSIIHGGHCDITDPDEHDIKTSRYFCRDGSWVKSNRESFNVSDKLVRFKRWDWITTGSIGDMASSMTCTSSSLSSMKPPTFASNCPPGDLTSEYLTPDGQDMIAVTWTAPTPSDIDGSIQSLVQVLGLTSGSNFQGTVGGKEHSVVYVATGNDGLNASCHFSFKVSVPTCEKLVWPNNGDYTCSHGNQTGSMCTYTCDAGYQLSGSSSVTCQNASSPAWTSQPTCEKVSCGSPPSLANGEVTCADNTYTYGTACLQVCNAGYRLEGSVFIRCTEDGIWTTALTTACKDDTAPDLFCLTPQVFYADRSDTTTLVTPETPAVVDNEDPSPSVSQTSGPDLTAALGTGVYSVAYKAVDNEGNESPECIVELRVQEVSCGHPQDIMADANMVFSCTGYTHGDQCTLGCYWNLLLDGTDLLTCECNNTGATPMGYWSWGSGSKPYCQSVTCPELDPPRNGYVEQDTVSGDPLYAQYCHSGYAVPDMGISYNGVILCHNNGWSPNFSKVPDCIVAQQSEGVRYSTEIVYYNGTCGSENQLSSIQGQLSVVIDQASTLLQGLCPANTSCSAINPVVSCTNRRKRAVMEKIRPDRNRRLQRKRSVDDSLGSFHQLYKRQTSSESLMLEFELQANFDISGLSPTDLYNYVDALQEDTLNPAIQSMIDNSDFNVDSWSLQSDSFQSTLGDLYCQDSYMRAGQSSICKPCPSGYYMANSICKECPVGQYSETAMGACTSCPTGYSTRFTASASADNCTKMCGMGTYSPDTFEPCAECPLGTYQSELGQTTCIECPSGQSTTSLGSSSVTDCQYFDILLNGTGGEIEVGAIASMDSLSLMFWVKKYSSRDSNTVISVNSILDVTITDSIRVHTPFSVFDQVIGTPSSDAWSHVVVVWDTSNNRLSVYVTGDLVVSQDSVTPSSSPLVQNGHFKISADGISGVYLSGISLQDSVIGQTEVDAALSSCHVASDDDLVSMGDFGNLNKVGLTMISPSVCDPFDECVSLPCGSHDCINEMGGYICTCYNGWTGNTCNTPPDFCSSHECTNSGICVSGDTNYTCECPSGYSGTFCDVVPVDGGLSGWSYWTECNAACNGSRSRERSCDSPQPGAYGSPCTGDLMEIEVCNTEACTECPTLSGDATTGFNCSSDVVTGIQTCTVQCQSGYVFPAGLGTETYQCGLGTGYLWEPMGNVPNCVAPVVPSNITLPCKSPTLHLWPLAMLLGFRLPYLLIWLQQIVIVTQTVTPQ